MMRYLSESTFLCFEKTTIRISSSAQNSKSAKKKKKKKRINNVSFAEYGAGMIRRISRVLATACRVR
jgi:hypothetical protein